MVLKFSGYNVICTNKLHKVYTIDYCILQFYINTLREIKDTLMSVDSFVAGSS